MEINQNKLSTRLLSLDVFRGITIAVMIIVNCPGLSTAYSFLEHSDWNGYLSRSSFSLFYYDLASFFCYSIKQFKKKREI